MTDDCSELNVKQGPFCFICNNRIGVSSRNSVELFHDKVKTPNEPAVYQTLQTILHTHIDEETAHSNSICRSCNKLCSEYKEIEQRLKEIQAEIVNSYRKTLNKLNERSMVIKEEDQDTSEGILESALDNLEVDDKKMRIKTVLSKISKTRVKDISDTNEGIHANEDGHKKTIVVKKFDVTKPTKEPTKNLFAIETIDQEEYFDENNEDNMVEIVTENDGDEYDNLIIQESSNFESNENSIDEHALIEAAIKSSDNKEMLLDIKLEPEDDFEKPVKRKKVVKPKLDKLEPTSPTQESPFFRENRHFFCSLCPASAELFAFDCRALTLHLRNSHQVKVFICDICGEDFKKRNELNEHLNNHLNSNEVDIICDICDRSFDNLRLLRIHKRTHYVNQKTWNCDQCNKAYGSKNLLDEHMNMHTGQRPFKCSQCPKDFASKYTLSAHLKIHSERPRPYECKTCHKSFFSGQNLHQHEKTHTGEKAYICEYCNKAFGTHHNLQVHKIVHSGSKPFICRTCGKAFARRAEIKDHERTHTGERPYSCDLCGASFAQRSNLQSHKRATHFNDKRYKCEICKRSFKRRRLLEYHIKATHTGERPYKCETCSSTFVYPEHYKKHLRIHSGDRPFNCEVCDKSFNSRDNRNAHRFVHSDKKPYECATCSLGFMRKPLLYAHMQQLGHLSNRIVVNQPHINKEGLTFVGQSEEVADYTFGDKTEFYVTEMKDFSEEFYEEHIEEEGEEEEHLIIDGQVQFGTDQITAEELSAEEILDQEDFTEDQLLESEDGQYINTENGAVQILQIQIADPEGKNNMAWVNLVPN